MKSEPEDARAVVTQGIPLAAGHWGVVVVRNTTGRVPSGSQLVCVGFAATEHEVGVAPALSSNEIAGPVVALALNTKRLA